MSQDELAVMDGGQCILQLRGVRPFKSKKFDIESHTKYDYLSDANPDNRFDIAKHLSDVEEHKAIIRKNDRVHQYSYHN